MLGGHAYTVTGNRITKTNISTGTTADLAGANISGCADAYTGARPSSPTRASSATTAH